MNESTQWMLERIAKTETLPGLQYLAQVIKMDADHGAEYATSPHVEVLRKAWGERKKVIETLDVLAFDGTRIEREDECQ